MSNIGHIYKLTCSETGKLYIGSTTTTLKNRLRQHRGKYNTCASQHFISPKIELIESIEYTDYEKLLWRERFHIETTDCVNYRRAIRTKEEKIEDDKKYREEHKQEKKQYLKEYYEEHKEEKSEYNKKYNEEHKEEKNEHNKKYYEEHKEKINKKINCECGGKYIKQSRARHFKTKLHQGWITSNEESI